ncbi:hypothetical protein C2G38_2211290 [Gigaspora rosea]|uniref:Uncharacterized protein n=1 Tax=Gigaspora rosea TaxID=44941 RepID=A0A397UH95_9GLOM|nr:hypothetical protein C2G38_2211290 [Gigaspora rosea]
MDLKLRITNGTFSLAIIMNGTGFMKDVNWHLLKIDANYLNEMKVELTYDVTFVHTHLDKLEIKMTVKFFEKLSSNYLELLEDKEDFNVIIKIGEAPNAKLMLVACELILEELAKYLETFLIESNAHWLRLNFVRIHQESFQNDKLLKGIAQNPDLSSNPEDWSNENFLTLKSILKNCLPLICYFQMSGDDIYDHIQPYKKIIEKTLWKNLVKRHMECSVLKGPIFTIF